VAAFNIYSGHGLGTATIVAVSFFQVQGQWLISSLKGEVKKNTTATAGFFLASQPTCLSTICSDLPHQVLGCRVLRSSALGFLYERFSSLLRNEASPN